MRSPRLRRAIKTLPSFSRTAAETAIFFRVDPPELILPESCLPHASIEAKNLESEEVL